MKRLVRVLAILAPSGICVRTKQRLLRILAALLVLAVLFASGVTWFLWRLDLNEYKSQIATLVSQQMGWRVELTGPLEHHFWPLQVSAREVRAHLPDGQALDIALLWARISLGDLLARHIRIDELGVVVRSFDLRPSPETSAGPPPKPSPIERMEIGRLRLEIHKGRFRAAATEIQMENLIFTVAPLPVLAEGWLVSGGPVGVLKATQRGTVRAQAFSFGPWNLQDLDLGFTNHQGTVTIEHFATALKSADPTAIGVAAARFRASGRLHLRFDEPLCDIPPTPWTAIEEMVFDPLTLAFDDLTLNTPVGPLHARNVQVASSTAPLWAQGVGLWERITTRTDNPSGVSSIRASFHGATLSYAQLHLDDYSGALDLGQGTLSLTLERGRLGVRPPQHPWEPIGALAGTLGSIRLTWSLVPAHTPPPAPSALLHQAILEHCALDLEHAWFQAGTNQINLRQARIEANALPLLMAGRPIDLPIILAHGDWPLARLGTRLGFRGESLQWPGGRLRDFALTAAWGADELHMDLERGALAFGSTSETAFVPSITLDLAGTASLGANGIQRPTGLPERVLLKHLVLSARQDKAASQAGQYGLASGRLEVQAFPLVRNGTPIDPSAPDALVGAAPDHPSFQLSGQGLGLERASFATLALDLSSTGDTLLLKHLEAQLAGTKLTGNGDIHLGAPLTPWDLQLTSPGLALAPLLILFQTPYQAQGNLALDLDLHGNGLGMDQMLSALTGRVRMTGKDLEILDTDLDAILTQLERSRGAGLLDIGAYVLLGPAGILLTKGTAYSILLGSIIQRGKSRVTAMRSVLRLDSGVVHTEDVAIATPQHRLAIKGTLDLRDQGPASLQIATLDSYGCAKYVETIAGTGRHPEVSKMGVLINSLFNPVQSVVGAVTRAIVGSCWSPFYTGLVGAPP